MPRPSFDCTVLSQLANSSVNYSKILKQRTGKHTRSLSRWLLPIHFCSTYDFHTLTIVSANFQRSLSQTIILLHIHGTYTIKLRNSMELRLHCLLTTYTNKDFCFDVRATRQQVHVATPYVHISAYRYRQANPTIHITT